MNMKEILQSADLSFLLSQKWNSRENQFSLDNSISNELTQSNDEEVLNSKEKQDLKPNANVDVIQIENKTLASENLEGNIETEEMDQSEQSIINKMIKSELQDGKELINDSSLSKIVDESKEIDFNSWLLTMPIKSTDPSAKVVVPVIKETKNKPRPNKADVENSIETNLQASSETLAKLLASQGYTVEAISMYEKLSLLYPEKKDIFADLIKKLKI